jgi:hypothetical protein
VPGCWDLAQARLQGGAQDRRPGSGQQESTIHRGLQPRTNFSCGVILAGYPGCMKLAAVTTPPETIPAY